MGSRPAGPGGRPGGIGIVSALLVIIPFLAQFVTECASAGAAGPILPLAMLGLGVALTVIASSVVAEQLWLASDGRRRIVWAVTASAVVLLIGGAILAAVAFSGLFPPGTCVVRPSVYGRRLAVRLAHVSKHQDAAPGG